MAQTTKNTAFTVATEISPISLELTPKTAQVTSGVPVVFTTQGSASYDGSSITISWELASPVGSHVENLVVSTDTLEATLYPDVNGVYKVTATASNESGAQAVKSSYVITTASLQLLARTKADAAYIGNSVGSFWRTIENKEAIETIWSEYVNALSGDFKKAAEVVLSKSIQTIQTGRTVHNYILSPELDISKFKHVAKITKSFAGTNSATTSSKNFLLHGLVLNSKTVLVLNYTNTPSTINSKLTIYSSNTKLGGVYTINKASGSEVTLSSKTPVLSDTVTTAATIRVTPNSTSVYSASNISAGSYMLVRGEAYKVTQSSDPYGNFLIEKPVKIDQTIHNVKFHTPAVLSIEPEELSTTNVVYVPSSEIGGYGVFNEVSKTIDLAFVTNNTITAPVSMGSSSIGSTVAVISGKYAGLKSKITAFKFDAASGLSTFTVSPKLPIPAKEFTSGLQLRCAVKSSSNIKSVLFTSEGISNPILSITYFKDYASNKFARIVLKESVLPHNKTNLSWRVCSTISSTSLVESMDYQKEGVSFGDLIEFDLTTSISDNHSTLKGTVVGVYKNSISFEPTNKPLRQEEETRDQNGVRIAPFVGEEVLPSIQDEVVYSILSDFNIPSSIVKAGNKYEFTSLAKQVQDSLTNSIEALYYTQLNMVSFDPSNDLNSVVYITNGSADSAIARVGIKPLSIRRNSKFRINAESPIASIPTLTEFIYSKQTSTVQNSDEVAILHTDGTITYRNKKEAALYENVGFFIKNNMSFSGDTLKKNKGLIVEDEYGYFINRGVTTGDLIQFDGVSYYIKSVLSSTRLELLKTKSTSLLEKTEFTNKIYVVTPQITDNYPYITIKPGLFTASDPIPKRLYAKTVILDNVKQVENNFGVLVGYKIKDFYSYSDPQLSYLNAIRGLMYAITRGPTVYSIELATAILLNLPVSQRTSEIIDIDVGNGKFVLQPVDDFTLQPLALDAEYYSFSTKPTTDPFRSVAINPVTGVQYKIGDVVDKFTPLTQKVQIEELFDKKFVSVDQFHKWVIRIDTNSISSRDLPHLAKFYSYAKPIHTLHLIDLVLYLTSDVKASDTLKLEGTLTLTDDPALGLELTHSYDASNSSGQVLRLTDKGELSTRTLFLGKDLTALSSTRVESERGGFLLNTSDVFSDDSGMGVTYDVKEIPAQSPFTGTHFAVGRNLVRTGDILRIYNGVNAGIYEVTNVVSDSVLDISPLTDYGIYTRTPQVSTEAALFGVYRLVKDIIISSVTCASVSGTEATFNDSQFNWDGVSVGDVLVDIADHTTKHTILDIPYDPLTTDAASKLVTNSAPTPGTSYFIYRPLLISKDYASGTVGSSYNVSDPRHIPHSLTNTYAIDIGDKFVLLDGSYPEKYSTITKVRSDSFEIAHDLGLSSNSEFKLQKERRPLQENSDQRLELLHGYDDVTVSLTSATAIAAITVMSDTLSGLSVRQISGLSSLPKPCDKIYLYSATDVLVFEGTVYYQNAASVVCFVDSDSITDYTINYKIKIGRRTKA